MSSLTPRLALDVIDLHHFHSLTPFGPHELWRVVGAKGSTGTKLRRWERWKKQALALDLVTRVEPDPYDERGAAGKVRLRLRKAAVERALAFLDARMVAA